jgi:hypothetical protein
MRRERFTAGPNKSDWFNGDVVARAPAIEIRPDEDALRTADLNVPNAYTIPIQMGVW